MKKFDSIAATSTAALKLHMSYGKYMAMIHDKPWLRPKTALVEPVERVPDIVLNANDAVRQ